MPTAEPSLSIVRPAASLPSPSITTPLDVLRRPSALHPVCADPVACDECLRKVARFLAREMGYVRERARFRHSGWYQQQLGADLCSMERAWKLRDLTWQACYSLIDAPPMREPRALGEAHGQTAAGAGKAWRKLTKPADVADSLLRFLLGCAAVGALLLYWGLGIGLR